MSTINIHANQREIVSLPCKKGSWVEIRATSQNEFYSYVVRESDLSDDAEIDIDQINNIHFFGNEFERVLVDDVQFVLILINDSDVDISINLTVETIPIKDIGGFGPLSAFH